MLGSRSYYLCTSSACYLRITNGQWLMVTASPIVKRSPPGRASPVPSGRTDFSSDGSGFFVMEGPRSQRTADSQQEIGVTSSGSGGTLLGSEGSVCCAGHNDWEIISNPRDASSGKTVGLTFSPSDDELINWQELSHRRLNSA